MLLSTCHVPEPSVLNQNSDESIQQFRERRRVHPSLFENDIRLYEIRSSVQRRCSSGERHGKQFNFLF
jgi:hypothetical protein